MTEAVRQIMQALNTIPAYDERGKLKRWVEDNIVTKEMARHLVADAEANGGIISEVRSYYEKHPHKDVSMLALAAGVDLEAERPGENVQRVVKTLPLDGDWELRKWARQMLTEDMAGLLIKDAVEKDKVKEKGIWKEALKKSWKNVLEKWEAVTSRGLGELLQKDVMQIARFAYNMLRGNLKTLKDLRETHENAAISNEVAEYGLAGLQGKPKNEKPKGLYTGRYGEDGLEQRGESDRLQELRMRAAGLGKFVEKIAKDKSPDSTRHER